MEFRETVWERKCCLKCTAANRENNESKCLCRLCVCVRVCAYMYSKSSWLQDDLECQRYTLQHEVLLWSSFISFYDNYKEKVQDRDRPQYRLCN